MKTWLPRQSGPLVAKLIVPAVLLVFTGSSLILLSPHFGHSFGSAGTPHCAMKPGITR